MHEKQDEEKAKKKRKRKEKENDTSRKKQKQNITHENEKQEDTIDKVDDLKTRNEQELSALNEGSDKPKSSKNKKTERAANRGNAKKKLVRVILSLSTFKQLTLLFI